MQAGELRDRITLQRLNQDAWENLAILPTIWAAVEPQGDATYRFRIRARGDLGNKADIQPAMRVLYRGVPLELLDIVEASRLSETHLIARRIIVEDIQDLDLGRTLQASP